MLKDMGGGIILSVGSVMGRNDKKEAGYLEKQYGNTNFRESPGSSVKPCQFSRSFFSRIVDHSGLICTRQRQFSFVLLSGHRVCETAGGQLYVVVDISGDCPHFW